MFDLLKALIYGVVEGITEWLPVSSTGHLILVQNFIPFGKNVSPDFPEMFNYVIQLGAILAVIILFWKKIWPFQFKDKNKPVMEKDIFFMWVKILIACVPAAVIGILFDDILDKYLYRYEVVSVALIVFGIAFIIIETKNKGKEAKINSLAEITYTTAALIGMFQLIAAIFPGTSRSGATIVGALLIGVSRTVAAEFTFFLAIPVMAGASLLKMLKYGFSYTTTEWMILLLGMVTAFIVSMVVIKFLMGYIKKHDFKVFGWYRIVLGIAVLGYFAFI